MKITKVEGIVLRQLPATIVRPTPHGSQDPFIVRISTDAGITGYGEAATFAPVAKAVVEAWQETEIASGLGALLTGQDALDTEALWQHLFHRTSFYGRNGVVIHAISAIDLALWDIRGKAAGLPVSALLGGRKRDWVPAYATVGMPADLAELPDLVAGCRAAGFTRIKFGLGAHPAPEEEHVELIAAARAAVGQDATFMIDLGRRWTSPEAAIERAIRVERYRPDWLEEPFQPDDHAAYRALTAATSIPISGGEADARPAEYEVLLDDGLAIVQPDLGRVGGFATCLEVARLAAARGRRCIPHEWGTGIAKAANLQLLAALETEELFEYRISATPVIARLVPETFPLDAGGVKIPAGPGFGIDVDDALLDENLR